jgi:hypothetical protein
VIRPNQETNWIEEGNWEGGGGKKMSEEKKTGISGSSTRLELMEFVFQCLQLQPANQVRTHTHTHTHTPLLYTYNSWQALARKSTCCRPQEAKVISIQCFGAFLCKKVHTAPI